MYNFFYPLYNARRYSNNLSKISYVKNFFFFYHRMCVLLNIENEKFEFFSSKIVNFFCGSHMSVRKNEIKIFLFLCKKDLSIKLLSTNINQHAVGENIMTKAFSMSYTYRTLFGKGEKENLLRVN